MNSESSAGTLVGDRLDPTIHVARTARGEIYSCLLVSLEYTENAAEQWQDSSKSPPLAPTQRALSCDQGDGNRDQGNAEYESPALFARANIGFSGRAIRHMHSNLSVSPLG